MDYGRSFACWRRALFVPLFLAVLVTVTGCQTVGYYAQAIHGESQILNRRQSCAKLLADPRTRSELKAKLELVRQLCDFAERELKLPANGHYNRYADLQRPFVVWNVYAAPQFSLEAKSWWYPFVGSLDYRGYFAESDARRYGERLGKQGYDIHVEGVEAYSTLGWFADPLLNTFLYHNETALAEILFHELAHQCVFAAGDTEFNEAFATATGEEGVRHWLRAKGDTALLERYQTALQRNARFVQLVQRARQQLADVYGDERTADGKIKRGSSQGGMTPDAAAREKQRILDGLKSDYGKLKTEWNGDSGYDAWFARGVNNAQLNSVATYYDLVPAFERLLAANGGDLEKFFTAAKEIATCPKAARHQRLQDQCQLSRD